MKLRKQPGELELEVRRRFAGPAYSVGRIYLFGDLMWGDFDLEEVEPGVVIDSCSNERRVVLQAMPGEVRFFFNKHRDSRLDLPVTEEVMLGTLPSAIDALDLAEEFLSSAGSFADLTKWPGNQ